MNEPDAELVFSRSGAIYSTIAMGCGMVDADHSVDHVRIETISPLIFEVDWQALSGQVPEELFFFLHILNGSGGVRFNFQFSSNPQLSRDASPSTSQHTFVPTDIEATSRSLRYGFGIYQGRHAERFLTPDPPGSDFEGKAVVREVKVQ
jgi:hypothetical protein